MTTASKFGVQYGGSGGFVQPKLAYRFRIRMYGFGSAGSSAAKMLQNVQSCSRPKYVQEEVEVHSYNSRIRIGSKTDWEAINLVVRDDLINGSVGLIGQQLQKQYNFFEQTSAIAGSDYKFRMEIESLDGTHGKPLEVWNLEGCWVTNVDYGAGDYEDSGAKQTADMTIRFDNATHVAGKNSSVPVIGGDPFPDLGDAGASIADALGGFGDPS